MWKPAFMTCRMPRFGFAACLQASAILLIVLAAPLMAQVTAEDLLPPLTPREFHERECARWRQTLAVMESTPVLSEQADYDALYYHLTLDLRDFDGGTISGSTLVRVRSMADDLDELILDLCSALTVDSVIGVGVRPFTLADNLLTIALDRTYLTGEIVEVMVYYHGSPCQTNLFQTFTFTRRPYGPYQIPTIYTLSEPYGARDWWPSKNVPHDKADSVRVSIIVVDTVTATSNGVLESLIPLAPSSRMFTWVERYPIATYLVCLAATNYAQFTNWYISQNGDSVPIRHYPYPEKLTAAQTDWSALPAMMAFNAQVFGAYPFVREKYGHTMMSMDRTAMEHQCNTFYDRLLVDGYHTYDYVVQHELAHQWWGNDVTLATWPDIWLNEGFASYAEALWLEHLSGFGALRNYMFTYAGLRVVDPSGPVYNPTTLFDGNTVYNKGGWILHMLRGAIRDDSLFFAALREYRARHAYSNATTEEFLADVSAVVGYDVRPYVSTYLYRTNRPIYAVSFGSGWLDGGWQTVVRIRQTQTNPDTTFGARLDLRFAAGGDTARRRVENHARRERYYFALPFAPAQLVLDPDDWVLKSVSSESLPLTILNSRLSDGRVGEPYTDTLIAIGGGGGSRSWSLLTGGVPGLALTADGVLSGIPTTGGDFQLAVRVVGGSGEADTVSLPLHVIPALLPPRDVTISAWNGGGLLLLRWSSVAGADSYRVFRQTRLDTLDCVWIATTADTVVFDTIAPSAGGVNEIVRRYYEVRAVNNEP